MFFFKQKSKESLYCKYKANRQLIHQTEFVNSYCLRIGNVEYHISEISKKANKYTTLFLEDSKICWMQTYPNCTTLGTVVSTILGNPKHFVISGCYNVLLIKGRLRSFCGLDEGIIASLSSFVEKPRFDRLYVMSLKNFKKLDITGNFGKKDNGNKKSQLG